VRGRIPQDDGWRWFERITPTSFGQDSIKTEAAAFAAFIADLSDRRGLRPDSAVFLGYSNGANLISSVMLLHPGIIRQAILLRAMPVIEAPPPTDLGGTRVLVVRGRKDVTYGPFSPALIALLRTRGAKVTARTVGFGHEVGEPDARLIQSWLGRAAHPDESSGDAPRIG
jgi:phospholipase/carboxylesterase